MDFPGGAVVKNLPANAGDTGSSPGPGRSHMPRKQTKQKRPHNQLCGRKKDEARSDLSHLSSFIHLDDHGAHNVVSITNKSTTITVTPALATQALFPLQHHLKVRQKVHAKQ